MNYTGSPTIVGQRGKCRICGKNRVLDPHHIISQGHAKATNQEHLISNPGNVVLICRKCHDQTTASMVRKRLNKKEGKAKPKPKTKGKPLCSRCGRDSHTVSNCYAKTSASGDALKSPKTKTKPKPKSKPKPKPKTKTQKRVAKVKRFVRAIEKFNKKLREL